MNKLSVVIPNWNGKDMIGACLKSLQNQTVKANIIVVDNGSTDGSVQFIKKNFPDVNLIELSHNTGFTGGVNAGISAALFQKAKYVLLINNDAVADKHWAKELVAAADKHPEAGIVTGKLLRTDKKHIDSTGDFYTIWGMPFPRGRNQPDKGQFDEEEWVFGASGGASLYRSAMLGEIGLFDQDYFAYFEDVDISFRAQMAGWKVRYAPKAVAYHAVGGTSERLGDFARYHSTKNFMLLYALNMPLWLYLKYLPLFILQFIRLGISSTLRGKPHVFFKGVLGAVRLHSRNIRKRRAIQVSRKVPVSHIDSLLVHSRPPRIPNIEEAK